MSTLECGSRCSVSIDRVGKVLVVTALTVPALLGVIGLIIDTGLLMAAHGRVQSAADAAAMAAIVDLVRGKTQSTARTTAEEFVKQHNGLAASKTTVNIPPVTGSRAGESDAVEVVVEFPLRTSLVHILVGQDRYHVSARAVAVLEKQPSIAGVITLDTNAVPGIKVNGNAELVVNGGVIDNSEGGGVDESGNTVVTPLGGQALDLLGNPGDARIRALNVQVVGGVSDPTKVLNLLNGGPSPLHCRILPESDPLANLPVPSTLTDPSYVSSTVYPGQNLAGNGTTTLSPGVYPFIKVSGNRQVDLQPGVYVIRGGGLQVSAKASVTGTGVMIYNTGHDYRAETGEPDRADLGGTLSNPTGSTFADVSFAGSGVVNLTPISDVNSPFLGVLIYQRRSNPTAMSITGNGNLAGMSGTIYARSAPLKVAGNGLTRSGFVVSSLNVDGNGVLRVEVSNSAAAQARQVFLVE